MRILVAYASRHGATQGIAERIGQKLSEAGHEAAVQPVGSVTDVGLYDAVVLGAAVYYGSWLKEATAFALANRELLAKRPLWLFGSGPTGDKTLPDAKEMTELAPQLQARGSRTFAGAIDVSRLSFLERMVVRQVKAAHGDFRDWPAIEAWAGEIAAALALQPVPA